MSEATDVVDRKIAAFRDRDLERFLGCYAAGVASRHVPWVDGLDVDRAAETPALALQKQPAGISLGPPAPEGNAVMLLHCPSGESTGSRPPPHRSASSW